MEERIGKVPGVESSTVNFAGGSATVRYDETRLQVADIKSAVRQGAYEPATPTAPKTLPVTLPAVAVPTLATPNPASQTPGGAATPAASAADGHEGQAGSSAPPSRSVTAVPKASTVAPAAVKAPNVPAVDGHEGHTAPQSAMPTEMAKEMGHGGKDLPAMVRDMRNRFLICLIFTVPIFVYAPMEGFFKPPTPPFGIGLNLWLFFFASAAILYPSWPFFVSAWRALKTRTLGMAMLVVLSVGTGYLFSIGTTFFFKGGGQFFEAVAMLLVFVLLGHWLEMRARAGASSAIKALMKLAPAKASVLRKGVEIEIPTAEVVAGEIIVMRPGGKIPVDGIVLLCYKLDTPSSILLAVENVG